MTAEPTVPILKPAEELTDDDLDAWPEVPIAPKPEEGEEEN